MNQERAIDLLWSASARTYDYAAQEYPEHVYMTQKLAYQEDDYDRASMILSRLAHTLETNNRRGHESRTSY